MPLTKLKKEKLALAKRNSAISQGMKKYHEEKKRQAEEAEIERLKLSQRQASISSFRDAYKTTYTNLTVNAIRGILDSVKTGYLEQWSDFADYMIDTDPHIQGIINIRTHAISGKNLLIQPYDNTEEAKLAASFARERLNTIPSFDKFIRQLLMAEFKGASCAEIIYKHNKELKIFDVESIEPISLRKIKIRLNPIDKDGDPVMTSTTTGYGKFQYEYWDYGNAGSSDAVDVFNLYPGKFIIHSPGDQEMLHYRGILRAAAFVWFFKQAAIAFYVAASEKTGSPVTYAKVPKSTSENIRLNLVRNLNDLANDASAVFDEDVIIDTINIANTGGAAIWEQLIGMINAELSKLVLGGTLSVEASSTGANRALGEVMERTRLDLQEADANALSETLKHQLIKPLIENNLHVFGGKMPPLPIVYFDVITKNYSPISQMHLDAGVITNNELRDSVGLTPWSKEQGGENIAKVLATEPPIETMFGITNVGNLDNANTLYVDEEKKLKQEPITEDIMYSQLSEVMFYIENMNDMYVVRSEEGKNMGEYKTIKEAKERLREIEYFKKDKS